VAASSLLLACLLMEVKTSLVLMDHVAQSLNDTANGSCFVAITHKVPLFF